MKILKRVEKYESIMHIKILTILVTLSLLNVSCAEMTITENNIKKELQSMADTIKKNKSSVYKLDDRIVGKKGFFYILRSNGKLSYHPKKALINSDFSNYPFVQKILMNKNGCISFNADGIWRYVFFCEILMLQFVPIQ